MNQRFITTLFGKDDNTELFQVLLIYILTHMQVPLGILLMLSVWQGLASQVLLFGWLLHGYFWGFQEQLFGFLMVHLGLAGH